jgi:hypothetical protein
MEYLKAFTIGTSGAVLFQHLAPLSLTNKNYYDYSYKAYSIALPFHYGLWTIFALFIKNTLKLSLRTSLFIISILSITSVTYCLYDAEHCNFLGNTICNYNSKLCKFFTPNKMRKPYINYTTKEWLLYFLRNGSRHIINFNLIIYYFTKYFSDYYWLKIFIIGSSIFSYFITYLKVIWKDYESKLNYDYEVFAVAEPFIQGFDLMISLYILQNIFKFNLKYSLILWNIIGSCIQTFLAYKYKTYKYIGIEWLYYFLRTIITGFIKIIIFYYLITYL